MSKTFYRTYRPQNFNELVGQDLIRLTLKQAVKENRIAHAFLFTGPRGTGKTTTARILAKAVNCLTPLEKRADGEPCDKCKSCLAIMGNKTLDLMEIDAASFTGVDNIRQLTDNIELSPAELKFRVFIIDEVHMLSRGAFNALLKTLEEPPSHTIFILATTEMHKVPPTITSRCQRFSFRLLTLPEILEKLTWITSKEKIDIEKESLELISEAAHGGMRDAESLFAQVATLAGKKITLSETKEILGIAGRDVEIEFLESLFNKEISKSIDILEKMNNDGVDIFLLSHRILDYLRKLIFIKLNPKGAEIINKEISETQVKKLSNLAKKVPIADLMGIAAKIVHTQPSIKSSSYPHLPLELAIIEWGINDIPDQVEHKEAHKEKVMDPLKEARDEEIKPTVVKKIVEEKVEKVVETDEKSNEAEKNKESNVVEEDKEVSLEENSVAEKKLKKPKKAHKDKEVSEQNAVDLKTVLEKWTAVLQNIRDIQPALFSLLKVCSPVKIEDEALVISTPFKFHKDKLNDGRNRALFCTELNKIVGIKRICVVQDNSLPKNKVDDDEMLDQVKSLLAS